MKQLNFPEKFRQWFWIMYKELKVIVKVNRGKSEETSVERGLMGGHPPSMAAFVLVLIPLMIILERILQGIEVECKRHKLKGFANDLKLFPKRPEETEPS